MEIEERHDGLLWVDKHRPVGLSQLRQVHPELTQRLERLARAGGDLPHLLFYGPPGGGKRTRVRALLREMYGVGVEHTKVEHRVFKVGEPAKTVEVTTVSSAYHIEMNPSDAGWNDRLVVQAVIKEIAASRPLEVVARWGATSADADTPSSRRPRFKVVVLHEVDQLTRDAQQALRRTMEKYSGTCRLVLVADSPTRVIDPLRSRCFPVRVPAPTVDEVVHVLRSVTRQEHLRDQDVPEAFLRKVAVESERNLRRALLSLEASHLSAFPFRESHAVSRPDWQVVCEDVATLIAREQTPQALLKVRAKYYELLTHCIPGDVIFKYVLWALLRRSPRRLAPPLCAWAAFYQHRLCTGSKAILHLEAFAAKAMATIRAHGAEGIAMVEDVL
ncbi:hypothetical protein CDCA_CDCA05G1720 [Cyanidium caldarium]|uniref:ATPase AAA-type core domain-containing protein n=1 Tax=Cyanidium caldarium TaxID=2771 RepID=A0AAV9IUA2_CYACA|nr:hypothetical protein CDCA_CDCA05G1720 [Cyanidium caldarium]